VNGSGRLRIPNLFVRKKNRKCNKKGRGRRGPDRTYPLLQKKNATGGGGLVCVMRGGAGGVTETKEGKGKGKNKCRIVGPNGHGYKK